MKRKGISGFLSNAVVFALTFALGASVILLTLILTKDIDESYSAPFFFYFFSGAFFACLCATLSIFIHLPIHELGHLIFGLASGYRFLSFRIGRLTLQRCEGKFRLKFFHLYGSSGQCLMAPKEPNSEKMPTFIYNIGGGAMNIIFSLAALGVGFIFKERDHLFVALSAFAAVGGYMALTNLMPMRLGGIANDGYNALTLHGDPAAKKALSVQLSANEASAHGIRLGELPEEWFLPIAGNEESIHAAAHAYLRASRLLDLGRVCEAREEMASLLGSDTLLPIYEHLLRAELAFITALTEKDNLKIEALLTEGTKKTMRAMKNHPSFIRTKYALATLRGRNAEAASLKKRLDRVAFRYPNTGEIKTERYLISLFDESRK